LLKTKRFWLGLVIIVVTLYIAFQGIQVDQVISAIVRIDPLFVPPALVLFWLSYGSRVFRWQLLFTPYKLRWSKVLSTLSIGYFLSNITPLRVGDLVRAYLIANIERVPVGRALSSVVIERTADGLSVVLMLVVLLPIIPNLPDQARTGGMVLGILGIGAILGFALISLQRERGMRLLRRLTASIRFFQREMVWRWLENLIDGFAVLHSPRPLFGLIAWSISVWFFGSVLNWVGMRSIGLNLGLDAGLLVSVVTSLAVTAAPTPGQLGVFHLATQFALTTVYGVPKADALAFAFLIHAYVYVWLMALGTFFIWREGLSYGKLQAVESQAEVVSTP
jgi:glycosyltransferase 2 family protein